MIEKEFGVEDAKTVVRQSIVIPRRGDDTVRLVMDFIPDDSLYCAFCGAKIQPVSDLNGKLQLSCSCDLSQEYKRTIKNFQEDLDTIMESISNLNKEIYLKALNTYQAKYREFIKFRDEKLKIEDELILHLEDIDG